MEITLSLISLSIFSLLVAFIILSRKTHDRNLPPSPPSLPVIGHLHLIEQPLHRSFQKLAKILGPVISLRFGSQLVVVVSSQSAVEECFTKNDVVLANRPMFTVGKYLGYDYTTVVASPYGDHWRNLRRSCPSKSFPPAASTPSHPSGKTKSGAYFAGCTRNRPLYEKL